jgi:hypothetical protein
VIVKVGKVGSTIVEAGQGSITFRMKLPVAFVTVVYGFGRPTETLTV